MASRVLITGGSGFLGTNLVEHFRERAAAVANVDVAAPRHPDHASLWQRVDLLDGAAVREAVRSFEPTHVIHMGARTDLRGSSVSDYAANTRGVENVIDAIRRARSVERVVFASSRMVCRIDYQPRDEHDYCPSTVYGESKVEGEKLVRAADLDLPWTIVRPTSIWGPWFGVPYRDFFLAVARGRYVHVRGARTMKSFGYVGNTVYQLERLLDAPADEVTGRTLYLADYPPIDVDAWAELIRQELSAPRIRTLPVGALRVAARIGDVLERVSGRPAPLTTFRLSNLLTPMVYDLSPLRAVAGDLPVPVEEGVRRTAVWLRENGFVDGTPSTPSAT